VTGPPPEYVVTDRTPSQPIVTDRPGRGWPFRKLVVARVDEFQLHLGPARTCQVLGPRLVTTRLEEREPRWGEARLVVDAALELGGTPIDKLNGPFGLDCGY